MSDLACQPVFNGVQYGPQWGAFRFSGENGCAGICFCQSKTGIGGIFAAHHGCLIGVDALEQLAHRPKHGGFAKLLVPIDGLGRNRRSLP